ncbi:hypothetical protein KOE80_04600 [Alcaligenes sp. 13f]|uniref:hypothetical protein n=1 Tax=Alcaligenes sp. 13f TaxID=2841924 RepID=UPI001CF670D2|nr:hypothetical protein [Alcaligenes sp. 13f]MCB4321483.1 hypothetical protein [Alcaligenes sp. 13f]
MNLVTGPFDMFFRHGGWREFLVGLSWPLLLAFVVLIIVIIYFGLKHAHRDKDED